MAFQTFPSVHPAGNLMGSQKRFTTIVEKGFGGMRTRFSDMSDEERELYKEAIREQAIEYANAQGRPCFFSDIQAMLDANDAHPIFYSALGDAIRDSE